MMIILLRLRLGPDDMGILQAMEQTVFPYNNILFFMDFYPKPGTSLFGGIFEVLGRHPEHLEDEPSKYYDIAV